MPLLSTAQYLLFEFMVTLKLQKQTLEPHQLKLRFDSWVVVYTSSFNLIYYFLSCVRAKTALIVNNLIALTQGASIGDLTSLEELVSFTLLIFLLVFQREAQCRSYKQQMVC